MANKIFINAELSQNLRRLPVEIGAKALGEVAIYHWSKELEEESTCEKNALVQN